MKKLLKPFLYVLLMMACIVGYIMYNTLKVEDYTKNYYYMDTYITVKLSTNRGGRVDEVFKEIDNIYSKYQKLTDVYNENSDLYYINNNTSNDEVLEIDPELYKLISMGLEWYEKSNGLLNINMGGIISLWKSYRDKGEGIPSIEEINNAPKSDINEIVLLGDNKIKNTHPNIDLGAIVKGYATEKAAEYIKSQDITGFIINAGGNVVVGKNPYKDFYTVGIQSPVSANDIYYKVNVNNMAVVTSGGYERFYEYEGKKYHHIIDPNTNYPSNNMQTISVVTEDSGLADILSTTLFLMKVEDALDYVNKTDGVECIIYTNEGKILTSNGLKNE